MPNSPRRRTGPRQEQTIHDARDIYVFDAVHGYAENISRSSAGVGGNNWSKDPSISDDGRYVTFTSLSDNLAPATNGASGGSATPAWNVFVHDRLTGQTTAATQDTSAEVSSKGSTNPELGGDGNFVAYVRTVDGQSDADVYLLDRTTGLATKLDATLPGQPTFLQFHSKDPTVSRDGRFTVFVSNNRLYLYDRTSQSLTELEDQFSSRPQISGDGKTVVYTQANVVTNPALCGN